MKVNVGALSTLLVVGCFASQTTVFSAEPDAVRAKSALEATLKSQLDGASVDRRKALEHSADNPLARWLSGEVQKDGQWTSIDDMEKSTNERMKKYRSKRSEVQSQGGFHTIMARWCALNDLPLLARAHYFGILHSNPNDATARAAIGDQRVLDRWFSSEEISEARTASQRLVEQLEAWLPKVGQCAANLRAPNSKVKLAAIEALTKIADEDAIPAMEVVAAFLDGDNKKLLVVTIAKFRSREACLALARLALTDSDSEAGQSAMRELRKYPEEMFVPELLQMLSSTKIANQLVTAPNGKIALVTLVTNELKDAKYAKRLQKTVGVLAQINTSAALGARGRSVVHALDSSFASNDHNVPLIDLGERTIVSAAGCNMGEVVAKSVMSSRYVPRTVATAAAQNLQAEGKAAESYAKEFTRSQQAFNHQVCTVLRGATDATYDDTPELWWQWWLERNERYAPVKPTYQSYAEQRRPVFVGSTSYGEARGNFDLYTEVPHAHMQWSCLTKGTLVQTAEGFQPIEKIQIGDLVLSQNVESGELTLKPVIQTTVRPPKSTLKISVDGNEIQATGGHLWWVSGRGWVRTRDLKSGMRLQNATGTSEVHDVVEDPLAQETYNLVVDGFHTYFVGKDRILSYDNTPVKPTLRAIPGYGKLVAKH